MVPKLEFESDDQKFAENVTRSLLSHKAPVLERLQLKVSDKCEAIDVELERWAGIAIARNVREFVLKFCLSYGPSVTLPSSLFCSDTLETLKLNNLIYVIVPFSVSMRSLRTLHLTFVKYKDEESFRNLLSGCPNLEDLLVHLVYSNNVKNVIIVSPSLKRLSIFDYTIGLENGGYVINAPCLIYLEIKRFKGYEFCVIENAPMLAEAKFINVSDRLNVEILGSLKSAKRLFLELSPLKIEYPSGSVFYQLVSLEMCTRKDEWWNLLALMLDSSPKLQVLKLIDQYSSGYKSVGMVGRKWNKPKDVPECLLSHLETFEWKRYTWESEQEQEVATYILRNARCLKKTTFYTSPKISEKFNKLKERRKMLNELNGVVRASNSCHLVFQ
ncbi:F-box/FBD/LRR-repeat protein [Cardamine amara subsp. amara]|uniref:F-box/FBD/LRR-repeat protein n=1 Tax=Cardamine amara subsp. amara TaxID=228776 RepID=A0ABD1AM15_CARAN